MSMTKAAEGPAIRVERGTVPILATPTSRSRREERQDEADTQYIDVVGDRTRVVVELSKMEQILEYLKALYR